jgi:hypothetical protein
VHNNCGETSRGSTGRTTAGGTNEQEAMDLVRENPRYGNILSTNMKDTKWFGQDGWVEMSQRVNGVEIHYDENRSTNTYDDFKFKDWDQK